MSTPNPFEDPNFDGSVKQGAPNPFADPNFSGRDGALVRGAKTMSKNVGISAGLVSGDTAETAKRVAELDAYSKLNPKSKERQAIGDAFEKGDGFFGGLKGALGQVGDNYNKAGSFVGGLRSLAKDTYAMGEAVVEQTPNMLLPTAGMVAGGAAGSYVPVVGTAIGAFTGGAAGNTMVEGGSQVMDALAKANINPSDTAAVKAYLDKNGDKILGQSAIKGSVLGVVDTVTAGLGHSILNAPIKEATGRALKEMGVDMADKAAVKAAMNSPAMAERLGADAILKQQSTGLRNIGRNAGAAALEPAGEFTGEFVGQGLATGDWDTKGAGLEALSSIGQSGAMYAGQKAVQFATAPKIGIDNTQSQGDGTQPPVAPSTTPGAPPAATQPAGPTLGQSLTGTPMADLMGGSGLTGGANPLQAGLSTLTSDNQMYPGINTEPTGYTVDPETGAIIPAEPVGARQMAEPVAQVEAPAPVAQAPVAPAPVAPALGESLTGTPVADMLGSGGMSGPANPLQSVLDARTPSQRMGLNPESGGLTAAAAIAVDSGASPVTAGMGLRTLSGAAPASQPVAEQSTPQQQAQPPAQQPILNNGKPFTLAEVGKANQAIGGTAVSVPGGWAIQPPQAAQQPSATPATAMPPAATPAASAQSAILGRNSQPIAEGGQPFATREEAKAEKRMQPLMRVAPAEGGGFILKPATERQLAAIEIRARQLALPQTGEKGYPSLHGFLVEKGRLNKSAMSDLGFDTNPVIGNRTLFSPVGMTLEQATIKAKAEGYIKSEDQNEFIEALKRSLNVSPVYTPDGYEAMAEAQMQARYEDFLVAEQDGGAENDWSHLTPEELADTGYNDYDEATQAEIRALVAQAEALGVDAESILEDVAQRTENATQKDYENAAKSAIEAAIRSSEESRSRDLGQAGAEADPAAEDTPAAQAAVTGPAPDVRARNLAALKARMMAGQTKTTPTTPPAPNKATPAPEAGPTNQGAANGQWQETLLKAEQPTGAAAMVSGAPVAAVNADKADKLIRHRRIEAELSDNKTYFDVQNRLKLMDERDALVSDLIASGSTQEELGANALGVPVDHFRGLVKEGIYSREYGAADSLFPKKKPSSKKPSDTTKPGGFTEKVRKAAGKVDAAPAKPLISIDRVQLERDFRTYPTKVLEGVIANGGEKALLKAAGVKSAYAFDDLPVDDGAKAYVAYVEAGGAAVDGLPVDYNEWVRAQERDAESRRMQNTRTIRQENGKPFKSEDGARKEQDRFGLKATHKIAAVAGGFELQQMSIGEQIEARRIAEGRESYDEAQTAVLAEMGITGETPEGDIDATDAQWVEIERRVDARMRGEPILTSPTKADIEDQQARAEQAAKAKAAQDKADTARTAKERERKEVAAASVAAADTFELGQDAMANLTGQNDLQFSRAAAKEVRDLVTLHNLSEDNLMYAGKMGGIPVPSIGITKVETPFGGFGGITLIAPKDLIDPEAGVPVYDRDAWTARFPELNFKKIKVKLADALFERMSAARDLGGDGSQFMSMLFDELRNARVQSPDKIASLLTRYTAPKMLYAQEVLGKAIKPQMRGIKPETPFGHTKTWRDFVAKSDTRNMTEQREREFNREAAVAARAAMVELGEASKEGVDERTARMLDSSLKSYLDRYITEDGMNAGILDRALRDVKSFGQKEIDLMKMDEAVRKVVPLDDAGYKKWVAGLVEPLFEAPTITVRGSEVPVTLENVVDAMTIGKTAGAEKSMTFGVGKAASMLGKQFKSIDEIKAARDQVVSAASEKEGKKSTEALISEYQNHVSAFYTGKDWKGNIDTWAALDSSLEALTKAGRNPTDGAMNIALQRFGFKRVDAKGISLAKQALEALRDATTDYFEAKPQRAVRLNEFKGAVVPKGTSAEAIALLEENGITVEVHGNAEGAREKAIQKLAKKLDGKTGSVIFSRDTESPRTPAPTIRAAITKAYGNLLGKLEGKGLVTIAQTEREAIEAAAQARADKTGGDVEQIKRSMLASVQMQRVWHGSPHRFDKFSTEFMGKGEGAQAFGWGLYYASKREIAESYRGTLTYRDMVRKFRNAMPDDASIEDASEWADSGDAPKDMARVIKALSADDWLGFDYPAQALTALFKEPANFDISKELADAAKAMQGQLYEVEIPEDGDMLLWDKPLSEQPAPARNSAKTMKGDIAQDWLENELDRLNADWNELTGQELYKLVQRALVDDALVPNAGSMAEQALIEGKTDKAASLLLMDDGIKGIKYLDGTSRNAGDGSFNYVVFDGADTQIVDVKYSANGNIEGFFDRQTGKSFLVADNLTAASAPGTLMHEVGIHMAADGKLEPLFKRAGSLLKTGAQNEFIQRVKARMARAGETSDEEAAAYIVTEYENDRAKAPITIGKWIADLTAAVRAWLFSKGIILKAEQLTVADIAAVSRANARSMARGGPNGGPGGGIRRSFAGEGAATADKMALATARQRVDAGENAETVRKDTGWFKGVDGKWRFEISDSDASIKDRSKWTAKIDGLKSMRDAALRRKFEAEEKRNAFLRSRGESPSRISSETKREPEFKALVKALNTAELAVEKSRSNVFMAEQDGGLITVGDVLDHPALFSAYPKISETRVAIDNGLQKGNAAYSPESNTITIPGMDDSKQLLTVLLHEIQHGIQNIEGFATGGSPDLNGGFSAYKRLAGEVESRNTEARQGMTDAQRRETAPSATADTPDSDVIVVFNGKDAMSAPAPANADSRTALPATLNIDGKDRPTTNSNGQPIHPTEEGVRNFWRWFGESKVVDERGRPLVVYHGGPADFTGIVPGKRFGGAIFAKENSPSGYGKVTHEIYLRGDILELDEMAGILGEDNGRDVVSKAIRSDDEDVIDAVSDSLTDGSDYPTDQVVWDAIGAIDESDAQVEIQKLRGKIAKKLGFSSVRTPDEFGGETIMIVDPLAIKSATGNTGAFSPTDPDIRFSRAADMAGNAIDKAKQTADKAMGKDFPRAASMPDLNDDQRSLLGKVGASQSPASDAIKAATDRAGLKIRQGMVDRFAALKELDEKALGQNFIADSITNSAWVLAKMSSAGSGALNAMMKSGRIEMDANQKVIGLKGAPNGGLTASLQKLGGPAEVERFFAWVAANRAEKLMVEGRENLFTPAEIAAGKTLNTGATEGGKVRPALYSQVHAEFQQYRDDVLAIAEQAGIINSENRAMWRDEFYVPFYRVMEDDADRGRSGGNGLSRQEAYKKLKGGKQNLNDLMENTLMNFHHLLSASLKNQAAVQAIKNAETVGIARKVPEARRDTKTSTFVLMDGKKVFYEVDDPLVFESITTLADPGLNNTAVRVMSAFKRVFTNMTTTTPQSIIANTFRDLLQASATSPTSKNIAKTLKEGIQSYRDEKTRAEMLASGGAFSFGHIYGMGADEVKASLQKTVAGAGLIFSPSMIPSILRKGWGAWGDVTDLLENASRAATYAQNVEQMGKLRAAFEARDVMDFSQHGAWPAVRLLVRIVPFLNARLQGLDKLYRSGLKPSILTAMGKGTDTDKQAAARFAMVTGALTLATMALYLVNADDDEYKRLPEWQKDTYWFIRIGDMKYFLPKPFEVGAIATIAERTLQQAMDDKATGKLFRERMWDMLMQTFAFNPTPQMFQPLVDVYSNKDAFTGRDIETAGMERMSTGLRSRDTTTAPATALSAVSRVFGDESSIAVSPVQADHLIKGYLGGVGVLIAGVIDTMYRAATGESEPDKSWMEYQPFRRFMADATVPNANTRYTTLFYDGLKEANRVYADVMELQKLGRPEDAATLAAEKRNVLQMRIALNAQQRRMTEINNRMKEVRRSDKDGEWKRREIDLLNTQKAMITERMGKRIEDARVQ